MHNQTNMLLKNHYNEIILKIVLFIIHYSNLLHYEFLR